MSTTIDLAPSELSAEDPVTLPSLEQGTCTYILDTSVLLSDPRALLRFKEHEVVIPVVVITELEHHANLIPWQQLARLTGGTVSATIAPA